MDYIRLTVVFGRGTGQQLSEEGKLKMMSQLMIDLALKKDKEGMDAMMTTVRPKHCKCREAVAIHIGSIVRMLQPTIR